MGHCLKTGCKGPVAFFEDKHTCRLSKYAFEAQKFLTLAQAQQHIHVASLKPVTTEALFYIDSQS